VSTADEEKRPYSHLTQLAPWAYMFTESQSRETLKKWLSPPDNSTNHNITRKAHHKGTASWFFQGSIFEQWKSSPSLLWIHGKGTFLFFPTTPHLTDSRLCSGIWQKRPVVRYFLLLLHTSTQTIAQLWRN
jgi:hypothetical protein